MTRESTSTGAGDNGKLHIFSANTDAIKKMNLPIDRELILKQWKEIKFFTVQEFDSDDSPDSGLKMNIEFLKILDSIRKDCSFPFTINSGFRTPVKNALVGGKESSAHLDGLAADIKIIDSQQRFKLISTAIKYGITRVGIASTYVHLDIDFKLPQCVCWLYSK